MKELEKKVNERHEESMEFAEMAFSARRRNDFDIYYKLIQRALNLEKAAARALQQRTDIEPSRSVLYQSAAWLALNIDAFDEAEQLITEALEGTPPQEVAEELAGIRQTLVKRRRVRQNVLRTAEGFLEMEEDTDGNDQAISQALAAAFSGAENFFGSDLDSWLNRIAVDVVFRGRNKVNAPDYMIFDRQEHNRTWTVDPERSPWGFWKHYKDHLNRKNIPVPVIKKLDELTDDILGRLGNPATGGSWDKRGMIVGDVQSGKTSNYIGLINKAADAGYRIIIVLSGLYENLRKQTQLRVDEGFTGRGSVQPHTPTGVGLLRKGALPPVHSITHSEADGDIKMRTLRNNPLNTTDYYAIVVKKNPTVLKSLLTWFVNSSTANEEADGSMLIRNIPVLVIDDEADYASLNISKDAASSINSCIRALLGLFDQSAFIGYTATPFANVFIEDINQTADTMLQIGDRKVRLREDLFPRDFIINLPPPSNYIGYQKVFRTQLEESDENEGKLTFIDIIPKDSPEIPEGHRKNDDLPQDIPDDLKRAVRCFVVICAVRMARGQEKEHSSMLVHISWYIRWINKIAELVDAYMVEVRNFVRYDEGFRKELKSLWEKEFSGKSAAVMNELGYNDPRVMENSWTEIEPFLMPAVEKISVRAVHGPQKGLSYVNTAPLDYEAHPNGLWVIAVGGNKLSRGLTLEGLSVSYFLRATRFYDTLLQMGRWFGYRPGYADLCRVFTTDDLVLWYQYIAKAAEDLKDQFDIMELADRKPKNYGLKVLKTPGNILMISSPAKIRAGVDLEMSFSGQLLETYLLSKDPQVHRQNLRTVGTLLERLGVVSGKVRQSQGLIWEQVTPDLIDQFLTGYRIGQQNIQSAYVRAYLARQVENGNLVNWTVVVISNNQDQAPFMLETGGNTVSVGKTSRQQRIFKNKDGSEYTRDDVYWIRKSHIISPPHEYLDMDDADERLIQARKELAGRNPSAIGKYIRKYRQGPNALLVIYILDPEGFGGGEVPAVGYAISLPAITDDRPVPYLVNARYIEEITAMYQQPADAAEDVYSEEDGL